MADPSRKPLEISAVLDELSLSMYGCTRVDAISRDICVECGGPATEFHNEESRKEYTISGFCQTCQDEAFDEE